MSVFLLFVASTWAPPPELEAAWDGVAVDVTTPSYDYDQCIGRFQLSDGLVRVAWEELLPKTSTVRLEPATPDSHTFSSNTPLMLTFQVWCKTDTGDQIERVHLSGVFAEPDGQRLSAASSERSALVINTNNGKAVVGGPAAVLVEEHPTDPYDESEPLTNEIPQIHVGEQ